MKNGKRGESQRNENVTGILDGRMLRKGSFTQCIDAVASLGRYCRLLSCESKQASDWLQRCCIHLRVTFVKGLR